MSLGNSKINSQLKTQWMRMSTEFGAHRPFHLGAKLGENQDPDWVGSILPL